MKKEIINTSNSGRNTVTILGIKVNSTPKKELLKAIEDKLDKKIQFVIFTPNPEIILQAQSDPELTHSLNSADFSVPDGIGLKFVEKNLEIIKGRQLMIDLFKIANEKKLKVYLFGSRHEVIKKAILKIKKEFVYINIKGRPGSQFDKNANPVSEMDAKLESAVVDEINIFKPDILFVALASPKEQKWITRNLPKLKVICAMEVGGAIDYYSGFVKPVPKFVEKLNLEWLWRLIQEPSRIGRIFNALIFFPMKVIFEGHQSKNRD